MNEYIQKERWGLQQAWGNIYVGQHRIWCEIMKKEASWKTK